MVLQELLHLLPAMLLMFWALCKVVQDSEEAAGYGVMAWGIARHAWVPGLLQHQRVDSTLTERTMGRMERHGGWFRVSTPSPCNGGTHAPLCSPTLGPSLSNMKVSASAQISSSDSPFPSSSWRESKIPRFTLVLNNLWNSIIHTETQAHSEMLDCLCTLSPEDPSRDLLLDFLASYVIHGKENQRFIEIFMFIHNVT